MQFLTHTSPVPSAQQSPGAQGYRVRQQTHRTSPSLHSVLEDRSTGKSAHLELQSMAVIRHDNWQHCFGDDGLYQKLQTDHLWNE